MAELRKIEGKRFYFPIRDDSTFLAASVEVSAPAASEPVQSVADLGHNFVQPGTGCRLSVGLNCPVAGRKVRRRLVGKVSRGADARFRRLKTAPLEPSAAGGCPRWRRNLAKRWCCLAVVGLGDR